MLFPDQSPMVLIAVVVALLGVALTHALASWAGVAAARDLLRQRDGQGLTCPRCGQAFDPQRWARHNERMSYHGRYTVTPLYTCPRCGETVRKADPRGLG